MATVFDVDAISIEAEDETQVVSGIAIDETVTITPTPATIVQVTTEGPQGPPGLQNVYIQSNDPAVEFGWGPEEEGFVWLQT